VPLPRGVLRPTFDDIVFFLFLSYWKEQFGRRKCSLAREVQGRDVVKWKVKK